MRSVNISVSLLLSFLLLACTRNIDQPSNIQLDLSSHSQGAAAADQIFFISVNITGPGISTPIVWNWEAPWSVTNTATPPTSIQLTVPKGEARLIQYLAVSRTSAGTLAFEYGDAQKSIAAASEVVSITPAVLGTSSREVNISGRLMTGTDVGPTGRVAMKYKPAGKPSMRILYTEIFGGWFSEWIALEGSDTKFDYVLVDAAGKELATLFHQLSPSSAELATSNSVLQAAYPVGYRAKDSTVEAFPGSLAYLGFFGVGAAGKKVCYPSGGHGSAVKSLYKDNALANPVTWSSSTPVLTNGEAGRLAGGMSQTGCSSLTEYADYVSFNGPAFESDQSRGFKGPFRRIGSDAQGQFMTTAWEAASQTLNVSWSYLPGMFSTSSASGENVSPLTGVTLFYNLNHDNANEDILDSGPGGLRCDRLASLGFSSLNFQGSANSSASILGVTRLNIELNRVKVVLCPVRGSEYFAEGVESYGLQHLVNYSPSFKLVGVNTPMDHIRASNNRLVASEKFLNAELTNNAHILLPHVGDHLLAISDVTGISFSVDGGAWSNFTDTNPSISMTSGYVSGINLSDSTFTSSATAASNKTVRFKFDLTSAASTMYGFNSYTSPAVTLVGNACSSPSLKMKRKATGDVLGAGGMLSDVLANGSNRKEIVKLIWDGANCEGATAPISEFSVLPVNACFSAFTDLRYDESAFYAIADPKDQLGIDCTFPSGTNVTFKTPGGQSYQTFERNLAGLGITHAVVATKSGSYFTQTNPSSPSSPHKLSLKAEKLIAAGSAQFSLIAAKQNNDGMITDTNTSGGFMSSIAWTIGSAHFVNPGSNPFYTLTFGGTDSLARSQKYSDGTLEGSFLTLVNPSSSPIVAVSQKSFSGGSPLWITRNGSNVHSVFHFPSQYGLFLNQAVRPMGSFSFTTTERVFVEPINAMNPAQMFALAYADKLHLAAYNFATQTTSWSPAITLNDTSKVIGMYQSPAYQNLTIYVKKTDGTLGIFDLFSLGSLYSGSSWSTPSFYSASYEKPDLVPFDVVPCGSGFAAIGHYNGSPTQAYVQKYAADGYSAVGSAFSQSSFLGAQNRGACIEVPATSSGVDVIVYYSTLQSPSTTNHEVKWFARNGSGTSQCGLSPSGSSSPPLPSGLSTALTTAGTAGKTLISFVTGSKYISASKKNPYFIGYLPTASGVDVGRFTLECSGGTMSTSYMTLGSFGASPDLKGLSVSSSPEGFETGWFFGSLGTLLEVMLQ